MFTISWRKFFFFIVKLNVWSLNLRWVFLHFQSSSEYAISSIVVRNPISSCLQYNNASCTTSPTIGMRKTQSIDASYLDLRDYGSYAPNYPRPLSRAKSDFNLTSSSSASLVSSDYSKSTFISHLFPRRWISALFIGGIHNEILDEPCLYEEEYSILRIFWEKKLLHYNFRLL